MHQSLRRGMVTRLVSLAMLVLLARWAAAGSNVAMFRANPQHSGVYNVQTGATTDGEPRLKWRFKTQGWVRSSASIANGIVCIGSDDGNLYGLELASGQLKWKVKTGDWVRSSPAVAGGMAYVGSLDGNLYAVDLITGQRKWKFETGGPIYSSPAVDGGAIYFGSEDGHLYAVNSEDGKLKWKYDAKAPIYSSPAVAEGMVFFGVMSDCLLGVDSATGEEKMRIRTKNGPVYSSPAVADGVVYFGSEDKGFRAVDIATSQQKWQFDAKQAIYNSPVIARGMIIFGSGDSRVYAVDLKTGQEKWHFEISNKNGWMPASPAIINLSVRPINDPPRTGWLCFGTERGHKGRLLALDLNNAEISWMFRVDDMIKTTPAEAEGVICFGCDDGYVYALETVLPGEETP